jgi:hypothetical protein
MLAGMTANELTKVVFEAHAQLLERILRIRICGRRSGSKEKQRTAEEKAQKFAPDWQAVGKSRNHIRQPQRMPYAIQDNVQRAREVDHNTSQHLLIVFVPSAMVAALGGGLYAALSALSLPNRRAFAQALSHSDDSEGL